MNIFRKSPESMSDPVSDPKNEVKIPENEVKEVDEQDNIINTEEKSKNNSKDSKVGMYISARRRGKARQRNAGLRRPAHFR